MLPNFGLTFTEEEDITLLTSIDYLKRIKLQKKIIVISLIRIFVYQSYSNSMHIDSATALAILTTCILFFYQNNSATTL